MSIENTEMLPAQGWRARAKAYIKMKIINTKDRVNALKAVDGVKMPLYLARGGVTQDVLKEIFVKKVVAVVAHALDTEKYSTLIMGIRL